MDFHISEEHRRLQERCKHLAADFATRASEHDRDASHPLENYEKLRREGFYALNVPKALGGSGIGLLGHTLAFEALAQGCQATALAFNMHLSIIGPLMESSEVSQAVKRRVADLVVRDKALIAGNFSETSSTALIGAHTPESRGRRDPNGGYTLNGRKMFASMLSAADYVAAFVYPEDATAPTAGLLVLIPQHAPGRSADANWDTLGMRATRSDSLIMENCRVDEDAVLLRTDDIRPFRRNASNWLWGSYTAVYLGVGAAAYHAVKDAMHQRHPRGFNQSLAHHPDVRRKVAEMSVDLEAARLMTYHAAWLSDQQGPTPETLAALFRAKYMVGEAVSRITRAALSLGGAHALFKTSPIERLFRDGAIAPMQFPPSDFCLSNLGVLELGLDPEALLPPLKRE
jgi:alkylation response protein AidB-like acyl-CoA dehydrogenase